MECHSGVSIFLYYVQLNICQISVLGVSALVINYAFQIWDWANPYFVESIKADVTFLLLLQHFQITAEFGLQLDKFLAHVGGHLCRCQRTFNTVCSPSRTWCFWKAQHRDAAVRLTESTCQRLYCALQNKRQMEWDKWQVTVYLPQTRRK